mgnify:CR=1 FL=1|jgi:hypothetical protein
MGKSMSMSKNKGFILVEIILAFSLFTFFIGFSVPILTKVMRLNSKAISFNNSLRIGINNLNEVLATNASKKTNKVKISTNISKVTYMIDQKHRLEVLIYE